MIKKLKSLLERLRPKRNTQEDICPSRSMEVNHDIHFVGVAITSLNLYLWGGYCHNAGDYICGRRIIKFRTKIFQSAPLGEYELVDVWRYAIIPDWIQLPQLGDGTNKTIPLQSFEVETIILMPACATTDMYPSPTLVPLPKSKHNE